MGIFYQCVCIHWFCWPPFRLSSSQWTESVFEIAYNFLFTKILLTICIERLQSWLCYIDKQKRLHLWLVRMICFEITWLRSWWTLSGRQMLIKKLKLGVFDSFNIAQTIIDSICLMASKLWYRFGIHRRFEIPIAI